MKNPFPLIRHFSRPISAILIKLPITPNQITTTGLLLGVTGSICFLSSKAEYQIIGSLILLTSYILDNCDGEVARYKNLTSTFGEKFDTFVDWIVHALFFTALGYGTAQETGNNTWLWIGLVGSMGATINYLIVIFLKSYKNDNGQSQEVKLPITLTTRIIFIFRETFRSDFCFIVLILVLTNFLWILLPAAAIGAQVYWIMAIITHQKKYDVESPKKGTR